MTGRKPNLSKNCEIKRILIQKPLEYLKKNACHVPMVKKKIPNLVRNLYSIYMRKKMPGTNHDVSSTDR